MNINDLLAIGVAIMVVGGVFVSGVVIYYLVTGRYKRLRKP